MRHDGRAVDELRPVKVETNYLKYAEGSCLFEMGDTKVVCSASVEEGVPPFLKGTGSGWITSEYSMLPRSCQRRVARESSKGKMTGRTHEIQRLVGRSLRSVVDLESLGERTIWLDCDVLQADGGTRCASVTGGFVALCLALDWMKKNGLLKKFYIKRHVAAVSVGVIGGEVFLDLSYEEDSRAEVDMNIVMTDSGSFIELQGTAEREPFSSARMDDLIKSGKTGISKLIEQQKSVLRGVI